MTVFIGGWWIASKEDVEQYPGLREGYPVAVINAQRRMRFGWEHRTRLPQDDTRMPWEKPLATGGPINWPVVPEDQVVHPVTGDIWIRV